MQTANNIILSVLLKLNFLSPFGMKRFLFLWWDSLILSFPYFCSHFFHLLELSSNLMAIVYILPIIFTLILFNLLIKLKENIRETNT
jgi:hypothetical protein